MREFSAIINPPHATVLVVGSVERRPTETEDGGFKVTSRITVTLSRDHGIVDGAVGAELLDALRGLIESASAHRCLIE